ncbi:methyl-accepting chemotaxis protein [Azorhizobium oxalatiphilum]|uniref:Methyl-accepting chemotaxis protein n=1 Tax=Azorhizobium oxalatiphilum TaxID=980631 RepID=A0A917FFL0_9HYPH|nr:HAMP domain-containing methyl-accepting chemotaxis protein [Azorhizobium oxalatiphilum]GGF80022.1 methyl-accepting chemotaxis protein [Azorhizobium oxalatiphilum]
MAKLKLGIGLKLGIVSGLLVLLSAGVIVSRQVAMSHIEAATAESRKQTAMFVQLQEVDMLLANIRETSAEMRLSYASLENENLLRKINGDVASVGKRLDGAIALDIPEADRERFRQLKRLFDNISVIAADIYMTETAQLAATDARPGLRVAARVTFTNLANQLTSIGDTETAEAVAPLDNVLNQITLASWSYLIEGDVKQLNFLNVNADTGRRILEEAKERLGGITSLAPDLAAAQKAYTDYVATIRASLAQVQERQKIVTERATPTVTEAQALLKTLIGEGVQRYQAADANAAGALAQGMTQILIFSIVAIIAAVCAALYSVFGIARPIRHVSAAMGHVSDGDLHADIPYETRGDEVGDQARALIVFRDGLAEAERHREERAASERKAAEHRKAEMAALADRFEAAVGAVVETVASAAGELQRAAQTLSTTAEETTQQASAVAAAANEATLNVQTVAAAVEQLSASAREIGNRLSRSSEVAGRAVDEVDQTNDRMTELRGSADHIGTIVSLIDNIADQTNLLALNATIESARAGDAGRGFAVVAQEVKQLAGQTAKATADISERITGIQGSTGHVLGAITGIARTIGEISEGTTAIAAAMEEQNATTAEVSRNIQQAATGTGVVTTSIAGVERAAQASSSAATQVLTSATDLSKQAVALRGEVQRFLDTVRAA